MTRQRIFTIAAGLLVAGGLAGCSIGPVNLDDFIGTPSVEEAREARRSELAPVVAGAALKQEGTLTVGIPATETAPLSITSADGVQSGIDIDLAHALADELGLSYVSFVPVDGVDAALAETCDIVMGLEPGDAGNATVIGGYVQSATGLFARGDVTAPVDASSLSGTSVGLQEGSVSAQLVGEFELDIMRTPFANLNDAFEALEQGSVQYVVCDAYAGAYLAAAYSDVSFAGTFDEPTLVGIAVSSPELQTAVQSALETVETGGVGDIARARWVGDLPTLTAESVIGGLVVRAEEPAAEDGSEDAESVEGETGLDAEGETETETPAE